LCSFCAHLCSLVSILLISSNASSLEGGVCDEL
jgi:hypothetical protein